MHVQIILLLASNEEGHSTRPRLGSFQWDELISYSSRGVSEWAGRTVTTVSSCTHIRVSHAKRFASFQTPHVSHNDQICAG